MATILDNVSLLAIKNELTARPDGIDVFESAARSGTTNSADMSPPSPQWKGVRVFIKQTARSTGNTNDISIKIKNSLTGDYYTLLAAAQITGATSEQVLTIFPGIAVAANVSASSVISDFFKIEAVVSTGTCTFSVRLEWL